MFGNFAEGDWNPFTILIQKSGANVLPIFFPGVQLPNIPNGKSNIGHVKARTINLEVVHAMNKPQVHL